MAYVDTKPFAQKQGIVLAVAVNAAGVLAAILTTTIIKDDPVFEPTVVTFPEAEETPTPPPPKAKTQLDKLVILPPITSNTADVNPLPPAPIPPDPLPLVPPTPPTPPVASFSEPPIQPAAVAIIRDAKPDPRFAANLQPEYPESAIRRELSGKVTVRVKIGVDGRVIDAKLVSATDEVFVDNTLRQALRKWRFLPSTRDGKPEESWREMTVRFELPD